MALKPGKVTVWPVRPGHVFPNELRTIAQSLLQSTLGPRFPAGKSYSERPPVSPWYRSHTLNLLQTPIEVGGVVFKPGKVTAWSVTPGPYFPDSLRTIARSLQQSTLAPAVIQRPFVQTDWPLTPARVFAIQLRTWAEKYKDTLIGQDRLPAGDIYIDRPPVPPWYRSQTSSLQQSTLAPPTVAPIRTYGYVTG
jgi:hypothetical protein